MAKRSPEELKSLKDFCDSTYSGIYGSKLMVSTEKQYDPMHPLTGYCYKFTDEKTGVSIYQIVCSVLGLPETDFRVLMHEYGHIYLGHLDGIHEELDSRLLALFQNKRDSLEAYLNDTLGIDTAGELLDRVIDDPTLNHSLHNIAMDMEVNNSVLSKEDVEEMEFEISENIFPKFGKELDKYLETEEGQAISEEDKKSLRDAIQKLDSEIKVKLILPERYEFPDGLTYPDYLFLIVENIDKFVKMIVSLSLGLGLNGNVSKEDIQNMLQNPDRDWKNKSDAYKQGYQDALNDFKQGNTGNKPNRPEDGNNGDENNGSGGQSQGEGDSQEGGGSGQEQNQGQGQEQNQGQGQQGQGQGEGNSSQSTKEQQADYDQGYQDALDDLANSSGKMGSGLGQLLDGFLGKGRTGQGQDGSGNGTLGPWQDKPTHYTERKGIREKDHGSESREKADQKRKTGKLKAGGGIGCSDRGVSNILREVDREVDAVEIALNEVIKNMRSRVIKLDTRKDLMRNYNRGIVRSVISPAVTRKVTISHEQKIVYLIDISGSMDTVLIDRILKSISKNMRQLSKGLLYDIITWNTALGEHIKNINPRKPVPYISAGGGTSIAGGIRYFKENYGTESTLIVISDFEDNLEEWHEVEKNMNGYLIYGFNYGTNQWGTRPGDVPWKNMRLKNFNND